MSAFLVISALGEDREGIVKDLSRFILDCGGNIAESRMSILGGEFAIIMLVQGNDDALSEIDQGRAGLESKLGLVIHTKRTSSRSGKAESLPYIVEVVAMDHPGIVHDITDFFSSRNINIQELATDSYAAAHTGTPMFAVNISIQVPADISLKTLKADFYDYCDSRNLDAEIEAAR